MAFSKYIMDKLNNALLIRFLRKKAVSKLLLITVFFVAIFFSTLTALAPEKYEFQVGDHAPMDIKAPRDIEDRNGTNKQIKKAVELVEPRERIDPTIQIDIKKKIEKFFGILYEARELEGTDENEKLDLLSKYNELNLSPEELLLVLNEKDKALKGIESYIYEIITQVMSTGIKEEELDKEKTSITNYFMGLKDFQNEVRLLGIHIVNGSLRANRFLDIETTQQKIEEAKESVERVIIKRGSIIVEAGEPITSEQLQLLKDAGLTKKEGSMDYSLYFGVGILVMIGEALLVAYIYVYNRDLFGSLPKLYLILIIFLSVYFMSKTMNGISSFIAPIATCAMLIGILIDSRLAVIANLIMTVFFTLINGNNITVLITVLIGGTLGAFSVTHTHQRTSIFLSGLLVGLSNVVIIFGLGLMNNGELSKILLDSFYGGLNGLFCAILTIGSLPLWESAFGILTPLKLLELSNPNHPILKKLLLEAPGTYHHSIIVGNLSEAAAEAIGANGLFARVSAYYHDIGKLKRPYFFKENQLTSENPHDKITASLSALIITSHVKDGIELSLKHKVPREIIDIIEQHHGTTLVKYFYHKAINDDNIVVAEENYRYNGVKPQSKEAAIVMLADSVEAAVRSMAEPTGEKIKGLIEKIIADKLKDNQLEECDLTLKDIEKIGTSFRTVLMGIFHERIEYPELETQEMEVSE